LPVRPLPADDFDRRDARDPAGSARRGGRGPAGDMSGKPHGIYGLMAEFDEPSALVAAVLRTRQEGYRRLDAYSPFAIEELHEALGMHHTRLPFIVLVGGLAGCVGGYALQYWAATIAYPINVGGRPLHSWPAFIPITFECTILVA